MKFLTICTVKDTMSMCPPNIARQLMEATLAWMNDQKKQGKILEMYLAPGGDSAVISEYPSADALAQALAAVPMGGFLTHKVYALTDFNKSIQAYIETCKQAEKMFPAAPK